MFLSLNDVKSARPKAYGSDWTGKQASMLSDLIGGDDMSIRMNAAYQERWVERRAKGALNAAGVAPEVRLDKKCQIND